MSGFDATPGEIRRLKKALSNAKQLQCERCRTIVQTEWDFWAEQRGYDQREIAFPLIARIIEQIKAYSAMPGTKP